jgi:hypothetical protein
VQCGGILLLLATGPLPWSLALALHTVVVICYYLVFAVLVALSFVRVFLVVKVTVD